MIESLDRLSRQRINIAVQPLLSIINSGVMVVTLIDKAVYRDDADQIAIVAESNIREVARIPATEWLKDLGFFRNVDPSLPRKPLIPEARPPRPYNPQAFRDNYKRPKWLDNR